VSASDVDLRLADARERARDAVRRDPELIPMERETTLRVAQDTDELDVFTRELGPMNRLLAHPEATEISVTVLTDDGGGSTLPLSEYAAGDVVGVHATLPVGCLTISREPRSGRATHADIITQRVVRDRRREAE
jgi:hypothetical protein